MALLSVGGTLQYYTDDPNCLIDEGRTQWARGTFVIHLPATLERHQVVSALLEAMQARQPVHCAIYALGFCAEGDFYPAVLEAESATLSLTGPLYASDGTPVPGINVLAAMVEPGE
jgi:hypothetical protein